jgi:hypothetical protein
MKHVPEWIHVLKTQQKQRGVKGQASELRRLVKATRVGLDETSPLAVLLPRELKHGRANVDANVRRASRRNGGCGNSRARADVENALARFRVEQLHCRGNRDRPVVLAAILTNPAQVPVGDVLPAGDALLAELSFFLRDSSHLSYHQHALKIGDKPFAVRAATGHSSSIVLLRRNFAISPSSKDAGNKKPRTVNVRGS